MIQQPYTLVRFDAWSAGSNRRIHVLGSKPMILFTRRLMPAELRLQLDRETQKSGYLFHRLHFGWATRGLFVLEVRREQTIRRDSQYIKVGREALANFISPITLWLGNP